MAEVREEDAFMYSKIVVCGGVPSSLPAAALRLGDQEVQLEKARHQHEEYVKVGDEETCLVHSLYAEPVSRF